MVRFDNAQIQELYKAGMTAPDIAEKLGCATTTVYRQLDRSSVERRTSGRRRFSPEVEAEIVDRYRTGETYEALAAYYECSTWIVGRLLRQNGVRPRPMGGRSPALNDADQAAVVKRYLSGKESQVVIAAALGVSQSIVSRVLRRAGVVDPNGRERHSGWKGGRSATAQGYVPVLSDEFPSMRNAAGYILEHRLVMARKVGRPLRRSETVHHKNGNRADNRLKNLELHIGRHGAGATHAHCRTCTCFED